MPEATLSRPLKHCEKDYHDENKTVSFAVRLVPLPRYAPLIAGSVPTASAQAAITRVCTFLPADDSSAHYIWFNRFRENINKNYS